MPPLVMKKELNGYYVVRIPEHLKAIKSGGSKDFVYEHIVQAEKMLGRPLKDGEVIHHRNRDRKDNSEDNLIVFSSNSEHMRFHGAGLDESILIKNDDGSFSCAQKERAVVRKKNGERVVVKIYEKCVDCGAPIGLSITGRCAKCAGFAHRKVKHRPSKDELAKDILDMPMVAVGEKYGVSDNAVRKWMYEYGYSKDELKRLVKAGRIARKGDGRRKPACRPVNLIDENGQIIEVFPSITRASMLTGCTRDGIQNVCSGKQKTTSGMIWSYA